MAEDWSREEVEAVVADYLAMLASELRGEAYNKAAHNRALQRILGRRTHGSIERKHQSLSAASTLRGCTNERQAERGTP